MKAQQLRGFIAKQAIKATGSQEDPLIDAVMPGINLAYQTLFSILMLLVIYSVVVKVMPKA